MQTGSACSLSGAYSRKRWARSLRPFGLVRNTFAFLSFLASINELFVFLVPFRVQNDTMRLIYMYDENDPRHGSVVPGNLPNPQEAYKGYRSLFLTQKPHQPESMSINTDPNVKVLEWRNEDVELPMGDDTLYWCKMFKLHDIHQKSHVVKVGSATASPRPPFQSVRLISTWI